MPEEIKESQNFINLGIVLNKKGEVLMIRRRKKEEGRDKSVLEWAFPGGKQRYGESREECVRREILDETGYDVLSDREISMRIHPQFMVTVVYHLCRLNSPEPVAEPKEAHEVAEVRWVKPEEIRNLITTDLDPKVAKTLGF
jgi:8-oxo-dGTP diphosphatase